MSIGINYSVGNEWGNGFTANIGVTNSNASSLTGWTLEFYYPYDIVNIWNAEIVSRDGDRYVIRNLSWNGKIDPGKTASFGFNGAGGNGSVKPSGYSINGQPIGTAAPPPPPPLPLPTLSVADITVTEGNSGTTNATFTVKLSQASTQPVTVTYGTSNGLALAGSDYTAVSGSLTFQPGQTEKQITVPVIGDTQVEPDESFTLSLSSAQNATIAKASAIGKILNDDVPPPPPLPTLSVADITVTEGNSGTTNATFTVKLSQASTQPVTVTYGTSDGSARAGSDYTAVSGSLTFQPGQTEKQITVPVIGDTQVEPNESFTLTLAGAQNATIAKASATGTIQNDDAAAPPPAPPAASVTSTAEFNVANEWNSGFTGGFSIKHSGSSPLQNWTLEFDAPFQITNIWNAEIVSRTGSRYVIRPVGWTSTVASGGSVSFGFNANKNGSTSIQPSNYKLNGASLTPPVSLPSLSINDVQVTEGDAGTTLATFTVEMSQSSSQAVSVDYGTVANTAIANSDFQPTSGTLTFAPGETRKTFSVAIKGDTTVEPDETFFLELSKPVNANLAKAQGVGTILNDDQAIPSGGGSGSGNPGGGTGGGTGNNPGTGGGSPQTGAFNYAEALQKSILFYEAQRSGDLPDDNRIEWRGDSALNDGAAQGVDLSGGYYDAGDHVKFGLPMASSMTMLGWGVVEYRDAYESSGQLPDMLDAIRWGTDYIMKAHTAPNEFWGQVGQGGPDHAFWGPAEVMNMNRPAFKINAQNPGSDLAGEAAAALAAASIIFRPTDTAYADRLLTHAKQLFSFADTYRGRYSDAIPDAAAFYNSWSGYGDELVWSAAWLHKATKAAGSTSTTYLNKAETYYQQWISGKGGTWTQSWDDKSYGAAILLAQETGKAQYRNDVENWLNYWTVGNSQGQRISYTDGGLAWLDQWGSLRYSANTSFLAFVYSDTVNDVNGRYANFATNQINYMLGDNPNNRSYMVGFGENAPQNPHHRGAHGAYDGSIGNPGNNRHTLYGALVGGPSAPNDNAYSDRRTDYIANEVALDYNAGFTGALARLYRDGGGRPLNSLPAEQRDREFFVESRLRSENSRTTEIYAEINNRSAWPARASSDLSFRYFVDLSELYAAGYSADDVLVQSTAGSGRVGGLTPWDTDEHIYYAEVDFSGIKITPGSSTSYWKDAQIKLGVSANLPASAWDPTNDWSYQTLARGSQVQLNANMPVYEFGNTRLFGQLPMG